MPAVNSTSRLISVIHSKPIQLIMELVRTIEGIMAIIATIVAITIEIGKHISVLQPYSAYGEDAMIAATSCSIMCFVIAICRFNALRTKKVNLENQFDEVQAAYMKAVEELTPLQLAREIYRTFHADNALRDKELFELFISMLDGIEQDVMECPLSPSELRTQAQEILLSKKGALPLAITLVHMNIVDTLRTACDLLGAFTGQKCATSVKVIRRWDSGPGEFSGAQLMTAVRDPRSVSENRHHNDNKLYSVKQNTAMEAVLQNGRDVWFCDDLRNLKNYRNSRDGWNDDYNSTIAVPIRSFHLRDMGVENWGVFFADSKSARFDNDACTHVMKELGSRIAVMLYREERLKALEKLLFGNFGDEPRGPSDVQYHSNQ